MQIADALVAGWERIERALTPVVGGRGVGALYVRSLHQTSVRHPWLAPLTPGEQDAMNLDALRSAVANQEATPGAEAGDALLLAFHDLLASLVGLSLTDRLLSPVELPDAGAPNVQDTAP